MTNRPQLTRRRRALVVLVIAILLLVTEQAARAQAPQRTLPLRTYRDKLHGAWVGELAIGGWGEPNEFIHCGRLVPLAEIAPWTPATVNLDFGPSGDQVSVELPFLEALATRGVFAGGTRSARRSAT